MYYYISTYLPHRKTATLSELTGPTREDHPSIALKSAVGLSDGSIGRVGSGSAGVCAAVGAAVGVVSRPPQPFLPALLADSAGGGRRRRKPGDRWWEWQEAAARLPPAVAMRMMTARRLRLKRCQTARKSLRAKKPRATSRR